MILCNGFMRLVYLPFILLRKLISISPNNSVIGFLGRRIQVFVFTNNYFLFLSSALKFYRRALRDFRFAVESHRAGEAKFNVISHNLRATCLLAYLSGVFGTYLNYDHEACEFDDATIADKFQLGSDLQFLFRYCLVIHLTGLKNQG